MAHDAHTRAETASPRRWHAAGVLIVAALMDMIDATVVNVALPTIGRDLHASGTGLQWTVSAYLLAFAASLIIAGHLGDRYGRKRLFMVGVVGSRRPAWRVGSRPRRPSSSPPVPSRGWQQPA
jgi:MFS family permease